MRTKSLLESCLRLSVRLCCVGLLFGVIQASAQPPAPLKLKVVGGLATLSQFTRWEEPFWTHELSRLSAGKYSADIVPFDRAGIPAKEMLRLVELGVVPFGTMLMSALSAQYPQYTAPDLAGLNPDVASVKVSLAAFRPYLEKMLREKHGIEALAIYTYPAQVIFCKKPLMGLDDLAGRRIRVSSIGQADFVGALGGLPVNIAFDQIVSSVRAGQADCVITGALAGNTLGLPAITSHLYPMPLTWGLAIFGANRAAWEALPSDLRALLRQELPKLEAAIWEGAVRDSAQGIACNSGSPACTAGTKGAMTVVPVSPHDALRRQQIFVSTVLPHWLERCGAACADIWNQTIGPARGLALSEAK